MSLILTIVFALSAAQFLIELRKLPKPSYALPRTRNPYDTSSQPLLSEDHHHQFQSNYPLTSVKTRPRSKSKPEAIFIHPAESNIARADAVALEMGLAGSTERVQSYGYTKEEPPWEMGKGKDMAREMLLGGAQHRKSRSSSPPRSPFYIHDSDSDTSH
ncbi:hypothetical protein D9619_002640 [Psilocybe cf. subviscida]|uniref:Uncharacterized protein n=1 Tax=Psilocybe cf. subviscida TaxID=2480587 RepID=A0A8H5AY74_9AGAR|nr:hypothetical protein D9619_002640 [Psilocybe cf. subviscida]